MKGRRRIAGKRKQEGANLWRGDGKHSALRLAGTDVRAKDSD